MSKANSNLVAGCSKCGCIEKYSDGRCVECKKKKSAQWRLENSERVKKVDADWYKNNREKKDAQVRDYRKSNPDKRRVISAAWYAANTLLARAFSKEWGKRNPEARRTHFQNRRARMVAAGGRISTGLTKRLLILQKGKCPCCGLPLGCDFHLDHKMPLALGGSNTDDNIQLLRAQCNLKKRAKHPVDFMQEQGWLL